MLNQIMNSIRNHFAINRVTGAYFGTEQGLFEINGGKLVVKNKYLEGQYIAIADSVLNNGVYRVENFSNNVISVIPLPTAFDEEFNGIIYSLRVPYDFIQLVKKIETFSNTNAGEQSNVVSASFGIQSISYGTNKDGVRADWSGVFKQELHKYRRMTNDIVI